MQGNDLQTPSATIYFISRKNADDNITRLWDGYCVYLADGAICPSRVDISIYSSTSKVISPACTKS